ncbi:glycosyltransferase [Fibrella aquatica]|uniref:glycosyltransferase n=1 Tax=Fibrella aquatica TaxID=3242487 RepID=UPI003520AD81
MSRFLAHSLHPEDIVFVFRAYNIYYLSTKKIKALLGQSNQLVVDFDESDYLSLGTFGDKIPHWPLVKQLILEREQLLLSMPHITYFVSGKNESDNIKAHYRSVAQIRVLPNKLALKPIIHQRSLSTPLRLLLIGTYTYEPNLDMIQDLLDNLLPDLSAPGAYEFHVVGRGLPNALIEQLKSFSGVIVHGSLSDFALEALYQTIHLNLTLVRFGGGTKYKLVEALAYGIPIVATAASVEGLHIKPMKHYIPVTSHSFKESMGLLTQENYRQMQLDCRSVYEQHYFFQRIE